VSTSPQRVGDWDRAFHARPFLLEAAGRRCPISPLEAQLLLAELKRLPHDRHPAAEATALRVNLGLARGGVLVVDDEEARALLRAIEGIHARRGHLPGLTGLQALLLRRPSPAA
jgi:hypothetical protein